MDSKTLHCHSTTDNPCDVNSHSVSQEILQLLSKYNIHYRVHNRLLVSMLSRIQSKPVNPIHSRSTLVFPHIYTYIFQALSLPTKMCMDV
jgi:hypothetical protein